ncbi:MAG: LysE family translocator [Geobacteraceae bacterium]|nr:LysE family translocator [Geobacteraceae bacterium]
MISLNQLALFSAAAILLIFTPGPDIIYVMTRGMAQGRKAALAAAAGFSLGNFFHIFLAIVGLSALLTSSATAFRLVKYAGALYLIYLGIRMFQSDFRYAADAGSDMLKCRAIFRQSIIANVLNPKVAVFFLAFFPQFVDYSRGYIRIQMFIYGCTFILLTLAGFSLVGICSGSIGSWLQRKPKVGGHIGKVAGGILVMLGARLAM